MWIYVITTGNNDLLCPTMTKNCILLMLWRSKRIHSASYWPCTTWRLPETVSVSTLLCFNMWLLIPLHLQGCSTLFRVNKTSLWDTFEKECTFSKFSVMKSTVLENRHVYGKACSIPFIHETALGINCCFRGGYDGEFKWKCPGWVQRDSNRYVFFSL